MTDVKLDWIRPLKMSSVDKVTPSKATRESLDEFEKAPGGYLSALAGGKSPISMPPIPAWMLNTPMYSKLPMLPAPKGKITLYTTGLGEKVRLETNYDINYRLIILLLFTL